MQVVKADPSEFPLLNRAVLTGSMICRSIVEQSTSSMRILNYELS
jgi:hypothetical protein